MPRYRYLSPGLGGITVVLVNPLNVRSNIFPSQPCRFVLIEGRTIGLRGPGSAEQIVQGAQAASNSAYLKLRQRRTEPTDKPQQRSDPQALYT
jgi:hypothetical protein